jgi:hypothetical protein
VSIDALAVVGLVAGAVGIGSGWHGNDVVESPPTVSEVLDPPDTVVVDPDGDTAVLLLPPHAPRTSAAQQLTMTVIRT